MAKKQPQSLKITTQKHQISAPGGMLTNYLVKNMPIWANPQWLSSLQWREFVRRQPVATLCRDSLTQYLISLDWNIVARDSEKQDELKDDIKYYTRLFERGHAHYTTLDFSSHIEWIVKDLFDLPFGAASEIGREYDGADGKVVWIRPLDAGTLSPTLNSEYPVAQHYPSYQPVVFPRQFISRIFLSPRTEIQREGWGMAPPERIYLAMEMLNRGDEYYSKLLMNTPETGILDFVDMDSTTATEIIKSMREVFTGIEPLKIPVLYEHTTPAKWISFGKLPSEIMYDNVTSRYITIVTSGYGLSPSDIGFASSSNGGETLSGTIRQERRSAKSGKALAMKKLQSYFDSILPDDLAFKWVVFDDEKNVAMSRARMANANAFSAYIGSQIITPDEARRQTIQDGTMTITMPETIDRTAVEFPMNAIRYIGKQDSNGENKGSNQIGSPKAPSGGGQGEVKPQQIVNKSRTQFEVGVTKAVYQANQILGALLNSVREKNTPEFDTVFENAVVGKSQADLVTESVIDDVYNKLAEIMEKQMWLDTVSNEYAAMLSTAHTYRSYQKQVSDLVSKAEMEFIAGDRVDLLPSEDEFSQIQPVVIQSVDVKRSILEELIPRVILVSKSAISEWKYPLDTTNFADTDTIKLAKLVATEAYKLLPEVLQAVEAKLI